MTPLIYSQDCDREGCFGEEKLRERRDITSGTRVYDGKEVKCHHCCDSDFCNMHGCPDSRKSSQCACVCERARNDTVS